jgi:REP element-mobilizing transposase RayT
MEMVLPTHGGRRAGAGRPRKRERASEPHKKRPEHNPRHPVHVTIRVVADVSSLRRRDMYAQLREATIVTAKREDFRIVHMSIQSNHLHLIVEADHKAALSRGMQGFSISAARRVNATITERTGVRRTGKVMADRFHARPLTSPRAVRHALAYVLNNWRKHGEDRAGVARTWKADPFSSGPVFPGWKELEGSPFLWPLRPTYHPLIVFRPRTWLLAKGWQDHHPLISTREVPGR